MANSRKKRPVTPAIPLVSAPVASVISLIVPGLGQILAMQVRRGLLLLLSTASIVSLAAWRIRALAHREPTVSAVIRKAVDRQPGFVIILLVLVVCLWVWGAWDAGRQARKGKTGGAGIFVLVLALFFMLGWQISQIDLYKAVSELPDAIPPLLKVIWPWRAAVTYPETVLKAGADILVPCGEDPPPVPDREPGMPFVAADPTCGVLSIQNTDGTVTQGTRLMLTGDGFAPDTETQIWWIDPLGNEFRPRQAGEYTRVTTDSDGAFVFELIMPYRLIAQPDRRQIHRVEARQFTREGRPHAAEPLLLTIERMVETIIMGMMATFFGIILSIPVSFLAARNLMSGSWVTLAVYYATRTVLNIIRAIEPLIWALIAVVWVGLGPFAGIIALTIHSIAALGKLYSEAIENIDPGPIEAIQATGATRLQTIMFAVVPQMIPPFVSFSIYRWDINVRMSTVIGLVGGGGVGFLLVQYIRLLDYEAAGIAVWFIAITVAVLDYVSAEIRARFI